MLRTKRIHYVTGILLVLLFCMVGQGPCQPCTDTDGDGYGDPPTLVCPSLLQDCDDSDPDIHPEAIEGPAGGPECSDGLDNDCDGSIDAEDPGCQEGFVIDHTSTDITAIPLAAIEQAKDMLHIGYGHTSHGGQLTNNMLGLVEFANNGGKGLDLPEDIFGWNNGGTGGALDLEETNHGWLEQDCGYYPGWVNETREYLDDSSHADVNVILWSWCGQVSGKYAAGTLEDEYLLPMTQLEEDYPLVTFVYMTGHVDHWDDANNKAANQMIRDYCSENGKVLYDFADIESYDPDGTFYEYPGDGCDYYLSGSPTALPVGNWCTEWQESHTEGVDWFDNYTAHSYPINGNQKAYAAWWLWARLGGWDGK